MTDGRVPHGEARHATEIHRYAATNMISRHCQAEVRLYRALARVGVDAVVESPADEVVARFPAPG